MRWNNNRTFNEEKSHEIQINPGVWLSLMLFIPYFTNSLRTPMVLMRACSRMVQIGRQKMRGRRNRQDSGAISSPHCCRQSNTPDICHAMFLCVNLAVFKQHEQKVFGNLPEQDSCSTRLPPAKTGAFVLVRVLPPGLASEQAAL